MKIVSVVFSPEAREAYERLKAEAAHSKTDKSVFNAVNRKVELIKADIQYGEPIAKTLIPREYVEKYGVKNLFWVGLPNFWRMLYSLTNGNTRIEIVAFVVDILAHPDYDGKFGYKKK
jgi:hypothetical protein